MTIFELFSMNDEEMITFLSQNGKNKSDDLIPFLKFKEDNKYVK